ncbi:acyltransferase [uncultured Veillonella sp.]|uniref:acyltransferase n=1 Tax=uncultured Veillonella sp. TaxID=159268 RepID=UPI0025D4F10E|nr:acyltransferase [uncultured Veillonella sp.]MDY3974701.1 acyltransferase [Veillonella caviae]
MKQGFLPEITYMRGLCMLGVIGIHVGSFALSNPQANPMLIALLEILSRFTVPAFFFLSAFGLFYHSPSEGPFSYKDFILRRSRVVLWPYLCWSLLYIVYSGLVVHDMSGLLPRYLAPTLLFGNGYYHLYFMVILLWFYLMMPLWRWCVRKILKQPVLWLSILFLVQVGFNFWSSYYSGQISFSQPWLQYAYSMRLNYWVIHYIWIFLFGAVVAERYEAVVDYLWTHRLSITIVFALSVALMLGSYYYVLDERHYTLLEAIYTIHQLSPMGMIYTGAGTIYFLLFFLTTPMSSAMRSFWEQIGECSYGIYLIHPFMLIILTALMQVAQLNYAALIVVGLYVCTVCASYLGTLALKQLPKPVRRLLLGK